MYINNVLSGRKNNFDLLRFIAAFFVIFSHAYPTFLGDESIEPFMLITKQQITIGGVSVAIFFIISGFLILMSYDKSKTNLLYLKKRVFRIFPALIVLLILTVFILGPAVTSVSPSEYFTSVSTYTYIPKNLSLFFRQQGLVGVFQNNIYPNEINGSLWTLWYEFFFYVLIMVLGHFKLTSKKTLKIFFTLSILASLVFNLLSLSGYSTLIPGFVVLYKYVYLSSYFLIGMIFYRMKEEFEFTNKKLLLSFVFFLALSLLGFPKISLAIFGAYILFHFSFFTKHVLSNFTKYGDFSYGIYIYAFPIQQVVVQYLGNDISFVTNCLIVSLITFICSFFSWHLVEKKALVYAKN